MGIIIFNVDVSWHSIDIEVCIFQCVTMLIFYFAVAAAASGAHTRSHKFISSYTTSS